MMATEELEGFYLSDEDGKWYCEYGSAGPEMCGKGYVRKDAAIRHRESHKEAQRQLERAKKADSISDQKVGGQVLRDLANEIERGVLNIPSLVANLRVTAEVVDMLLKEIEESDLRELARKARFYDAFVKAYEEMKDATVQG